MQSTERDGRTGKESITISRALGDKVRACMQLMNTSDALGARWIFRLTPS